MSDDALHPDEPATPEVNRRGFLSAAAAAAIGVPALAGAWEEAPAQVPPPQDDTRCQPRMQAAQWALVHERIAAVVGADTKVRVLPLERSPRGFLQRIQTDDERTGTALATVLRATYQFQNARGGSPITARPIGTMLTVQVEGGNGTPWPPRTIRGQADLVYAMKDALASNPLAEGVLRASLQEGSPVVAIFRPVVVRLPVGAASDFFRHHVEPASMGASALFNRSVANFPLSATVRDPRGS